MLNPTTSMKEYGVVYAQVILPKEHKLQWLKHCALTNILPKDLQSEIKELSTKINNKYKDSIIIPMDSRIMPGCTTTPEMVEKVSTDIYNGMNNIFRKLINEDNCIRLVYGVGEMPEEIDEISSTHEIGNYPIIVKVGRYLDSSDKVGMFKA